MMTQNKLEKQFDLHMLIGIDDANEYLNQYEQIILFYGSNYIERLNIYYKYCIRKEKKLCSGSSVVEQ